MARDIGIALITGGAVRIGRAIAIALARRGLAIAIHHLSSADDAVRLAAEIEAAGGRAAVLAADLADADAIPRLIAQCRSALGAPTVLVNNASTFRYDTIGSLTLESWQRHLATNLTAPILLSQAFARTLPDRATGSIINVIDQRVLRPTPEFFSYGVTKAALRAATEMLAQALAPRIRVNAVAPGPTLQSIHQTDADFAAERSATLLGRGPTPEEVAAAVGFLLDAPAVTGHMLALDGGQHLSWTASTGPASAIKT
jgi:NAD(P)-dependent dehydrogenase (short-subunit alcohol dehydrogenase family)